MKSILQHPGSEPSRFDDSYTKARGMSNNASEPVVPHLKERYDPAHPDADWGGFVHRSYKKKAQYSDHTATRQNLTVDAKGGIMPDTDAAIAPSSFSGKKLFDQNQLPDSDAVKPWCR
jgi:hypothetical protein